MRFNRGAGQLQLDGAAALRPSLPPAAQPDHAAVEALDVGGRVGMCGHAAEHEDSAAPPDPAASEALQVPATCEQAVVAPMLETAAEGEDVVDALAKSNYGMLDGSTATAQFSDLYEAADRNAFDPTVSLPSSGD